MGWVPGRGGKVQRRFVVALGHTDRFQKEEMETAQSWQRRTDIPRERMPETESKSFVFSVTLLVISTSCTFLFPSRVGLDVVTNRSATMQTLCTSQGGVGRERNYFLLTTQKHEPSFASALILFLFGKHE